MTPRGAEIDGASAAVAVARVRSAFRGGYGLETGTTNLSHLQPDYDHRAAGGRVRQAVESDGIPSMTWGKGTALPWFVSTRRRGDAF